MPYQCGEENGALTKHPIPWTLTNLTWVDNNTIKAIYDIDGKKIAGPSNSFDINSSKGSIYINNVKFIIITKKEVGKLFNNYH